MINLYRKVGCGQCVGLENCDHDKQTNVGCQELGSKILIKNWAVLDSKQINFQIHLDKP